MIKVSVIVPLFNYARYIKENISSIINQTHTDWELIIIDDDSRDNPLSVITPFLSEKIRYYKLSENKGYSAAKNEGIRKSTGDYIVALDADDMLTPKSLEYRVKAGAILLVTI